MPLFTNIIHRNLLKTRQQDTIYDEIRSSSSSSAIIHEDCILVDHFCTCGYSNKPHDFSFMVNLLLEVTMSKLWPSVMYRSDIIQLIKLHLRCLKMDRP